MALQMKGVGRGAAELIFLPPSLSWVFLFFLFFGVFSVSGTTWDNMYLHVFMKVAATGDSVGKRCRKME